MELFLSSFLLLHLVIGTSAIRLNQELGQLKLPLDHVPASLSFSDVLAQDNARVKFLNSRLEKNFTAAAVFPGGLVEGTFVSAPLNPGLSLGVGNYYTKIGVGSPATYYPVVVDTGSSLSWIQCQPCLAYCHPQAGPFFNPSASNTYKTLSCEATECSSLKSATLNSPMCTKSDKCVYTATYGDQSFSQGFLSKDTLTFGSEKLPGFVYGCGQNNDGLFGKSAGLIGFAKSSLSMLSQLSTKYGKAFSYCLPTASGSGGYLSIGSHSTSSPPSFTPLLSDSRDPSLYFVKLTAITVSGRALAVPASDYSIPTIIDSGTTISRLAGPVYTALRAALVRVISPRFKLVEAYSILDACFAGTAGAIASVVPAVEMRFQGGAALKLAPRNLLLEVEKGTTCLSLAGNSDIRDSIGIIGNQQQQTTQVVYDVANSRLGFAAGGCR
ncbi:aspartyl protease family protein At5g10770-like [Salvia hispanica]|uniref:aspartyl protease family protein At5g10770-like n=1 Tax=Salvia hispanica TaxID=49212 RepID=UPI002009D1C9|nr:aspartyl protease family protein At5g10770-like [Salvia hispanica]